MSKPQYADNWWEDDEPVTRMSSGDDNWWEEDAAPIARGTVGEDGIPDLLRRRPEQMPSDEAQFDTIGILKSATPARAAPMMVPDDNPLAPVGAMKLSAPLSPSRPGYFSGVQRKGASPAERVEPAAPPRNIAYTDEDRARRLAEIDREFAPRWQDKVYQGIQAADQSINKFMSDVDTAVANSPTPIGQANRATRDFLSDVLPKAGRSLGGMLEGGGTARLGGMASDAGEAVGEWAANVPTKPLSSTAEAAVFANESINPFAPGSRAFANYQAALGEAMQGNFREAEQLVGEANVDAFWTAAMAIPALRAAKPYKPSVSGPPVAPVTAVPPTAPEPIPVAPQTSAFSAPPTPPARGLGPDRVIGAAVGAYLGAGGELAFADPGDGNDGPNQLPGAATGAAIGAIAPRAALNATRRVRNVFGNSERVASGAVRRILKGAGIRNADEARAAMTARFGDKPAVMADLSQEGVGTAAGISRLPGETGDAARLRYEDLQRERTGRVFSDVQATTGIDPETVTKSLDDAIKAASEEISPAYEAMFAANRGANSERLMELMDDPIIQPYIRRAIQASESLARTAGQELSNARTWDLVKRALDRTISAQFKSGGAAPELISARDAVRGALDNLIPEYKGIRDNADAPRMRAAREEGKGVLTGRNNTVEKIKQRASELTGRPLTAYQSGVIEGLVPTVEGWRNQLGSLTSAATEQKLAAAFGEAQARELVARMRADLAIQQNAGRINPSVGSVTSQAQMGGGAGPMIADALRLARSPVEGVLAGLSRSGAYTRSQRDRIGQMLLEGATDANLERIFRQRARSARSAPPPAPVAPAPVGPSPNPPAARRSPQRPPGGGGYKFERGVALRDTPQEYRDTVMTAPEGFAQSVWDEARKSTSWLPDPSQLQTRISTLEKKPFPSAADSRLLRAMKEMKARLEALDYEWPGTGRPAPRSPPERAGFLPSGPKPKMTTETPALDVANFKRLYRQMHGEEPSPGVIENWVRLNAKTPKKAGISLSGPIASQIIPPGFAEKAVNASPVIGAAGGGTYGAMAPLQDMDQDGDLDETDRSLMIGSYGMGGMLTPHAAKLALRGAKTLTEGAKAANAGGRWTATRNGKWWVVRDGQGNVIDKTGTQFDRTPEEAIQAVELRRSLGSLSRDPEAAIFGRKPPKGPPEPTRAPTPMPREVLLGEAQALRAQAEKALATAEQLRRAGGSQQGFDDLLAYSKQLNRQADELTEQANRSLPRHDPAQYERDKAAGNITYNGLTGPPRRRFEVNQSTFGGVNAKTAAAGRKVVNAARRVAYSPLMTDPKLAIGLGVGAGATGLAIGSGYNGLTAPKSDAKKSPAPSHGAEDPRVQTDWTVERRRNPQLVTAVQTWLNRIDPTYRLQTDGRWTANGQTEKAIRFWQQQNGYAPDGLLTDEQLDEMYIQQSQPKTRRPTEALLEAQ